MPREATVLVYARKGSVDVGGDAVPRHSLAHTAKGAETLRVANPAAKGAGSAEVLLLVGMPIDERVVASGTWVVSSEAELANADADYEAGLLGRPWPHTLSDDEWRAWNAKYGIG